MTPDPPAARPQQSADAIKQQEPDADEDDVSTADVFRPLFSDGGSSAVAGRQIGPYTLVREIGVGGMGSVYLAEREDVGNRVALKLVRDGRLASPEQVERFLHERRVLARLEHPHIARLYDAGATDDHLPYLVMEYVDGAPITSYCDERRLSIDQRLQLFGAVADAVQYAHRNLVIHRDIKPSNIMVTAAGEVKLLDFGVAKLLADGGNTGSPEPALTRAGAAPLTPEYASPEQIRGEPITTTSDVYSLGVVLYELLTGHRPYRLDGCSPADVERVVSGATPERPSTVVPDLRRRLAGDLDTILLKALSKEPERRYASAEQFAEDVRRHLEGLPVLARPDTAGYRAGKFIRRHRAGVAAASLLLVTLLGGLGTSLWLLARTRAERARAQTAEATQTQVTEFLRTVLISAKPGELGPRATVIDAIDAAVPRLDSTFRDRPVVQAALSTSLAETLNELGLPERALPLARRAHDIRERLDSGRPTREGATSTYNLAHVLWGLGQLAPAESLMRRSIAMYEAIHEDPAEVAVGYNILGSILADRGQLEESVKMEGKALAVLRDRREAGHSLIVAIANYASGLSQLGHYEEALPLLRESVARSIAERGPEDVLVGAALQPLAFTLFYLGRYAEADTLARRSYDIRKRALGPQHAETLESLRSVAEIWEAQGRHSEAIGAANQVIAYRSKGIEESNPNLGAAYVVLARSLASVGRLTDAETAAREALTIRRKYLDPTHWLVFVSRSVLGDIVGRQGRRAEAEADLVEGLAGLEKELGPAHLRTREARARLDAFRSRRQSDSTDS